MISPLERAFEKMGARVVITHQPQRWARNIGLALDVSRDKHGEYFFVRNAESVELVVLDVQAKDRHLLLMSREGKEKHRYLLGHDERHWFVAGVPEESPVSTVRDAKLALKPEAVLKAEGGLRTSKKDRRSNAARVRQGEWFFVPDPSFVAPTGWRNCILKDEPLSRGRGSKPHVCEELYRSGGETVYVSRGYDSGLTEAQYSALDKKVREARNWQMMKRDMDVWVRGKVRHADHATVVLDGWHRVYSNTEHLSFAMKNIRFLD